MGTETAVPLISIHDPNQPDQIPPESRSSHYCCHYCRWLLSRNIFVVLEIFACFLFNYSINSRHEVICQLAHDRTIRNNIFFYIDFCLFSGERKNLISVSLFETTTNLSLPLSQLWFVFLPRLYFLFRQNMIPLLKASYSPFANAEKGVWKESYKMKLTETVFNCNLRYL